MLKLAALASLKPKLALPRLAVPKLDPARLKALAARFVNGPEGATPVPLKKRLPAVILEAALISLVGMGVLGGLAALKLDATATGPRLVVSFTRGPTLGAGETASLSPRDDWRKDPMLEPYLEPGPYGPLPRISADGVLPAAHFARSAAAVAGRSSVSVVVTNLGLDEEATRRAINELPPDITLAFSPYAHNLQSQTALARATGHEFFIEVPLEPFDYPQSDPGPLVLLADAPQSSNIDRLHHALGLTTGYVGILTSGRARFATSQDAIQPIAVEVAARGILVLDDGRAPVSKVPRLMRQSGARAAMVERRLDDRPSEEGVALALIELERLAIEQGRAIGAMDLYPVALDGLVRWASGLANKGLVLQPVSAQMLVARSEDDGAKPNKAAPKKPAKPESGHH